MRIAFLGDIAFIGKYDIALNSIEKIKNRFKEIKPILDTCDFVIGNLESPFTSLIKSNEAKTLPLRSDIKNVELLNYLGIDAVSLANNHFYDYGKKGALECINVLKRAGILFFGIDGVTVTFTTLDSKVTIGGFCCFTTNGWYYQKNDQIVGLNTLTYNKLERFISNCEKNDSYPILCAHWGEENTHYPRKEHIEISDYVLEKKKATIVGHHPHVIQGKKDYQNSQCFFSLGNFCFDDCISTTGSGVKVKQTKDNLDGYLVILSIHNNAIENYEIIPYTDTEEGIQVNYNLRNNINYWSKCLTKNIDWYDYENRRKYEIQNAFSQRLGKRDIHWLKGHLNFTALCSVIQRKCNQKKFQNEIIRLHRKYELEEMNNQQKQTIVYIGNFDRPEKSAAGKRVFGNAKIFESLGYRVILIGKEQKKSGLGCFCTENISFYPIDNIFRLRYQRYVKWIDKFLQDKNICPIAIIRYGSPSIALFDEAMNNWCKKKGIPIIADVVDWLSADGGNWLFNVMKTIDTFFEKAIFNKRANGIIAISTFLEDYYRKNDVLVLPPVVEHCELSFTKNNGSCLNIVYAGSPFRKGIEVKNPHKIKDRLDLTIEVIANLPRQYDIKLHVFGITEDEYLIAFPTHRNLINKKRIIFYGIKPMKEVQEFIYKADFTILLREKTRATMAGFPTKIVESLSCGTPVITTDTSDLKQYIVEGENGFFVDISNRDVLMRQLIDIFEKVNVSKVAVEENSCLGIPFLYSNYIEVMKHFLDTIILKYNHS